MDNKDMIPENAIDVTPQDSVVPVYIIELTDEEKIIREQNINAFETQKIEMESKEKIKQSALDKLRSLGLTEEEAKAIIGL